MSRHKTDVTTDSVTAYAGAAPVIGRLAGMNDDGDILVEYGEQGAVPARLVAGLDRKAQIGRAHV